jgi:phosphoribosylformylglycinamidine synthase subunit PurS
MNFIANVTVMPKAELLDPQGKTVANNMKHLDIQGIGDVRIGKNITLQIEANNEAEASEKVETACKKLLANLIMETYSFSLKTA